jgi:hypothetical protein
MSKARGLGRRERVAGNRHFRGTVYVCGNGSESGTYKLGRKKSRIRLTRSLLTSSSASPDGREAAVGVRVAEIEKQEPASAGAPMVGPEMVSSPSHRIYPVSFPCGLCNFVSTNVDFDMARFFLTLHRLDGH